MSSDLDESAFEQAADEMLTRLEDALADLDDSLEVNLSMGVLTLAFESGVKFVVNSHRAAKQIWMAAHSTAWHFDPDGDAWVASKSNEELVSVLSKVLSEELGRPVSLDLSSS